MSPFDGPVLVRSAAMLFICLWLACAPAQGEPPSPWETAPLPEETGAAVHSILTPGAHELARQLGIVPDIENLHKYRIHNRLHPDDRATIQILSIRQQLTDTVLITLLQVQGVVAEIDQEITRFDELRGFMEAKRDTAIRLNSAINFLSGGALAVIGSGLQIPPKASNIPGNTLEVVAGSLQAGLSTYALKQEGGARRSAGILPNMLAKIFGRPTDARTEYPDVVWKFINSTPPGIPNAITRREFLIQRWVSVERIGPTSGKASDKEIGLLTGTIPQANTVTIDLLNDRSAMLADLRALVTQMNRDLLDLLAGLRSM